MQLHTLKSLKQHGGVDRALFSFDLHVDLTPAFHWNTKQLFVYVVAVYETDNNKTNQVVVWDKIVESPTVLDERNTLVKYALQGSDLRGQHVQLQLQWDHMPITGLLFLDQQGLETASGMDLPEEYR